MLFVERDSPRDQLIVTLFLLTVFGLLLGAGIKGKMEKAGLDLNRPILNGRRLWEVSLSVQLQVLVLFLMLYLRKTWNPRVRLEGVRLGDRLPFIRREEYDNVPATEL